MGSCRVILKKLVRDNRITIDEYEKLLRNLKPTITVEDAIEYLRQNRWLQNHDKEIYRSGYDCGKNERKTAKWIRSGWAVKCSECNYDMPYSVRNFCPCCGAKMEDQEAAL